MGRRRYEQNTPTGCGNDFHTRQTQFQEIQNLTFFQQSYFFQKSYKIQAWSGYRRARRVFFFIKNNTFLRNIAYFVCFKNINASCLRGGRRNLPNCPGTSPIAPRKKYPVRVNPSLRFELIVPCLNL